MPHLSYSNTTFNLQSLETYFSRHNQLHIPANLPFIVENIRQLFEMHVILPEDLTLFKNELLSNYILSQIVLPLGFSLHIEYQKDSLFDSQLDPNFKLSCTAPFTIVKKYTELVTRIETLRLRMLQSRVYELTLEPDQKLCFLDNKTKSDVTISQIGNQLHIKLTPSYQFTIEELSNHLLDVGMVDVQPYQSLSIHLPDAVISMAKRKRLSREELLSQTLLSGGLSVHIEGKNPRYNLKGNQLELISDEPFMLVPSNAPLTVDLEALAETMIAADHLVCSIEPHQQLFLTGINVENIDDSFLCGSARDSALGLQRILSESAPYGFFWELMWNQNLKVCLKAEESAITLLSTHPMQLALRSDNTQRI